MMKQLALDIGLATGPTLANFCAGPNLAALRHLELWVGAKTQAGVANRSPVPTYLWGPSGSGKSHLLKAVREALREQGARVGWLDACANGHLSSMNPERRAVGRCAPLRRNGTQPSTGL